MVPAIASALHLLALVLGLVGVVLRGRAMRAPFDDAKRDALLAADNAWGIAALLWIGTGLWRLFGATDKATSFYLTSPAFHLKLALFGLVFALELLPMVTFVKWRVALAKGQSIDTSRLATFRVTNRIQVVVVVLMVFVAAAMARGVGRRAPSVALTDACAARELFVARCNTCHSVGAHQGGLVLEGDPALTVGRKSAQWPDETLVVASDPDRSFLLRKLAGTHGAKGARMPLGQVTSNEQLELVTRWIRAGAPSCP